MVDLNIVYTNLYFRKYLLSTFLFKIHKTNKQCVSLTFEFINDELNKFVKA